MFGTLPQGRRGLQMEDVADRGRLRDAGPGGGRNGRRHVLLLHELGRSQSEAGTRIARQANIGL